MHIAQIFNAKIPPDNYGGIERIVFWLSRELIAMGHQVTVMADAASSVQTEIPSIRLIGFPKDARQVDQLLPDDVDVLHYHDAPPLDALPDRPYIVTEHGNRRNFNSYAPNTVFISKSHAANHGAELYVYNGIPLEEYPLSVEKSDFMLYMAKLGWRKKNAKTAIQLSLQSKFPVRMAGGDLWKTREIRGLWMIRMLLNPGIVNGVGSVAGARKLELLQQARILFYAVNWQEPFALAPHEALACGTPVLASPNGALTEYIEDGINGFIVKSYSSALEVLEKLKKLSVKETKEMAIASRASVFTASEMGKSYLQLYENVLRNRYLYDKTLSHKFKFSRPRSVVIRKSIVPFL